LSSDSKKKGRLRALSLRCEAMALPVQESRRSIVVTSYGSNRKLGPDPIEEKPR
jgi:hypothetical protein